MKIAISSKGQTLESPIDPRFGRAAYLILVDPETMVFEVLDNHKNLNALKGAGIQATVMIKNAGASVLMTGFCGPNAMKTLLASDIKVIADVQGSVVDAVQSYNKGDYSFVTEPNTEGHSM